ncbi:hypothetical protein L226DRAFT_496128 [Lentinus tigrinus ALCF2SS1-7]|uniref:Fungal-type protein kinase domain-containing protein n=1 Tax=Lentinus tigrinus ALCF2SS1-6 TaxID=1328759 RepID=A0A5C2RQR3_9APHY|nr:hypothetical protein L227DRAFT_658686 [Lentinus tigrinus ALCF2SS1-6]RPD68093.1 hypothetical protein L226DRAFT_496128 [Lentinus tigrinus ALCF2SS1-7]
MTRATNHRELRRSMHGKIAVMPYTTFMNSFVPDPRAPKKAFRRCRTDIFKDMPTPKNEKEMYREIPKRLSARERPCRGFVVVSTPHKVGSTPTSKIAPDCGIYPNGHAPKIVDANEYGRTDWSHLEIIIECKQNFAEDPFDYTTANAEPFAKARKSALDQILSYADLVFQNQHRKHHFIIIFLGTFARLVYIDRACIFATQRFNYVEKEGWLTEFLWRYGRLTPAQRGFDPSAKRLHPKSTNEPLVTLMRQKRDAAMTGEIAVEPHILEAYKDSLDDMVPWWKLDVYDDEDKDTSRSFVVGKPHFLAPGVRGRGTRCYIAQEVLKDDEGRLKLGDFVYLKDAWRVKHDEIEKEGTTLKFLNEKKVPHVPTVICHGDLPDQLTVSRAKWIELFPKEEEEQRIKEHQHYRIVVKEIGKLLSQFENSGQLVKAMYNVVQAHEAAYRHGIIHRDISGGNILLVKDSKGRWGGLLTDWELAKDIHKTSHERQPERTGTWQFMSAHVQNDPGRVVVIADELESVFHVLIFYVVRFCHHTLPDSDVGQFLYDYFDDYSPYSRGERSGRAKRTALEQGAVSLVTYNGSRSPINTALSFIWPSREPNPNQHPDFNHPLNRIIPTLLSWFQALYALDSLVDPTTQGPPVDHRGDGVKIALGEDEEEGEARTASQASTDSDLSNSEHATQEVPPVVITQKKYEATKKLASKLNSHAAMLEHLRTALLGEVWPVDEKTQDKRPKRGHDHTCEPISSELPPPFHGIQYDNSEGNFQEPLEASRDSSVPADEEQPEWVEREEDVEDYPEDEEPETDTEVEHVKSESEDLQTEGTLVEEVIDDPFAADIGLPRDATSPQCRIRLPPPLSSMTSTSSRKRRHDEYPVEEQIAPTKRSRMDETVIETRCS